MAHNLDITNGVASFVSAREDAWHHLGTTIDRDGITAEEAMTIGHLGGWNVRKAPLFVKTEKGYQEVPERVGIIRDNPVVPGRIDVIGQVGNNYGIIQNEAHADLLNALVDESGASFTTAGALDPNGRRVFITMKLPGTVLVGGEDRVDNYVAALNSHDGSTAFSFMVTPVRIVCSNTLNFALSRASHLFKVRHTSGATKGIVQAAREALDLTFTYLDDFQEQANQLIDATLTQQRFEQIIETEFGAPEDAPAAVVTRATKRLDKMAELFADASTQDGIRNTAWAGLMAITEWNDHFAPARGEDPEASRARRALMDPGFKNRALELMMAVAS